MNSEQRLADIDDRIAEITDEIYRINTEVCDPVSQTGSGEFNNVAWLEAEVNSLLDERQELIEIIHINGDVDY